MSNKQNEFLKTDILNLIKLFLQEYGEDLGQEEWLRIEDFMNFFSNINIDTQKDFEEKTKRNVKLSELIKKRDDVVAKIKKMMTDNKKPLTSRQETALTVLLTTINEFGMKEDSIFFMGRMITKLNTLKKFPVSYISQIDKSKDILNEEEMRLDNNFKKFLFEIIEDYEKAIKDVL